MSKYGVFLLSAAVTCDMILLCSEQEVSTISEKKKPGRHTDSLKDMLFRLRIDEEVYRKLEQAAEQLGTSKSEVVRQGINLVFDSLPKQ